jgi:LAS superfamily LD-carboxypeptidase LdcB
MPLWGQNKQKVKVRSIFPTNDKLSIGDSVNQKTTKQIQEARNKIRTNSNTISKERVDESVLEFRKLNEASELGSPQLTNLNPLILYEKNELETVELPTKPEIVKPKLETATESYKKFKEQNLTTKYKSRKKISTVLGIIFVLVIISGLAGLSYFNIKRLENDCVETQKTSQKINLDIRQGCYYEIKNELWNFGYNYSHQVKEFKSRVTTFDNLNQEENENLKSKISSLNILLNQQDLPSNKTLLENKSTLEILTKEKETKLDEFKNLLNKTKYLDEALNNKKSYDELNSFGELGDSEKLKAIEALKKRIDEISKNTDPKRIDELLKYKYFEGNEWKDTYEKAKAGYENIKSDLLTMNYFGDPKANSVAIEIAEKRGFAKRMLVKDEGQLYNYEGQKLQKPILDALKELFNEMRDNKLKISLISGFRGIEEQTQIFDEEFKLASVAENGKEFTLQEIIDRKADNSITKTLETVALPGYSRHHFGYTIDVEEEGTDYKLFENTKSYEWMSKDNFYNIKKYGIIPSYPKGVNKQGPEPESWEFVYVGIKNTLTNPEI